MIRRLGVLAFLALAACQIKPGPTQVSSSGTPQAQDPKAFVANLLKEDPVILDARPALDFGVGHAPGAINVLWSDFARTEAGQRGLLPEDLGAISRRLALYGITPTRPVIVVGWGRLGVGEEGRVAWMLRYFGVRDVRVLPHDWLRSEVPREDEAAPQNAPAWKPDVQDDWAIFESDFRKRAIENLQWSSKARSRVLGRHASAPLQRPQAILDVSGPGDVDIEKRFKPQIPVKKWDWRRIYGEDGRIRGNLADDLAEMDLKPDDEIVVADGQSVAAAAVVFALRDNGFHKARVLLGGTQYLEWAEKAVKR